MTLSPLQSKHISIANGHDLLQSTPSLSTDPQNHTSVSVSSPSTTFTGFQNTQESIKYIEYDLIMNSRELTDVSLVQKLFQSNSEASLFKLLDGVFVAQTPSSYIQKIRSIYYLLIYIGIYPQHLIKQSSPSNPSKFLQISELTNTCITLIQSAFITMKLEIYKNDKISRQHKKYAAQFFEFLKFDINKLNEQEAVNNSEIIHQIITSNINKYPIMDEIFIEVFIIHLITKQNLLELSTIDDNYNIALVLKAKFNIECEFLMFREFVIEGEIEGLMVDCGFSLKKYTHYIEQLTNHMLFKQEEIVNSEKAILLDVSRTKQYNDQVFKDAEKSYIFELSDVSDQNQQTDFTYLKPISPLKINFNQKPSSDNPINFDKPNQRFIKGRSMMTISANYSIKDISPISNPALKSNIIDDSNNCQANVTSLEDCINSKLIKLARNVSGVSIEKNIELPKFTHLNSPTNSVELAVNANGNYLPKYNSQHQTNKIENIYRPPTKNINEIQYKTQIKLPDKKPPLPIPNNPQIFKHTSHHRIPNHCTITKQQKHQPALRKNLQISNNMKTQYSGTKNQSRKQQRFSSIPSTNILQTQNTPMPYRRPNYQPQSMKLTELRPNIMNTQPSVPPNYKSIQEIPRSKISLQPKYQVNLQNRHHKNQINNHISGNPGRQYQSQQIQNVGRANYPIINPQFHQIDKVKMNWGTPKNGKMEPCIRLNNQRPLYKL